MSRLIFVGSCQASSLCAAYNTFVATTADEYAGFVEGRSISEAGRALLHGAEIACVQVSDQRPTIDQSLTSARLIHFPYMAGAFLWPYATEAHPLYFRSRLHEFGAYGPETGDAFLNRLLRDSVSPGEARQRYLAWDVVNKTHLLRRFELYLATQENRDLKCGMQIADYIRDRITQEQLFTTRGHPSNRLFLHLADQVFRKLGVPAENLARMAAAADRSFFPPDDLPVHPAIAAALQLPYGGPDYRYRLDYGWYSFGEFVERYMAGIANVSLRDGLRLVRSRKPEAAIPLLRAGLAECPESVDGRIALATLLVNEDRIEDAFAIFAPLGDAEPAEWHLRHDLNQLRRRFAGAARPGVAAPV
jgi:hypothetical protein